MGIASRTPIRVYPTIQEAVRLHFMDFKEAFKYSSKDSLIFGFVKPIGDDCHAFLVVQAAKYRGSICTEWGISPVERYPYYKKSESLSIGTLAFRDRSTVILSGEDCSYGYSLNDLSRVLARHFSTYASPALRNFWDAVRPEISMAQHIWCPLYEDWKQAEEKVDPIGIKKFPELEREEEADEFLRNQVLGTNRFDRFLGPLKRRYEENTFYDCHLYLMASALEFLNPPPLNVQETKTSAMLPNYKKALTWADILGPAPTHKNARKQREVPRVDEVKRDPMEDPIRGILGRDEQSICVKLDESDEHMRSLEFAFMKSLSALEVLFNS